MHLKSMDMVMGVSYGIRPVDCMGKPGFTIINQQYPKLTGPSGNRPQSDLKSHPK